MVIIFRSGDGGIVFCAYFTVETANLMMFIGTVITDFPEFGTCLLTFTVLINTHCSCLLQLNKWQQKADGFYLCSLMRWYVAVL